MPDPGHGELAITELGKCGLPVLARAPRQQCLPDHLAEKGARIEMLRRSEVFE